MWRQPQSRQPSHTPPAVLTVRTHVHLCGGSSGGSELTQNKTFRKQHNLVQKILCGAEKWGTRRSAPRRASTEPTDSTQPRTSSREPSHRPRVDNCWTEAGYKSERGLQQSFHLLSLIWSLPPGAPNCPTAPLAPGLPGHTRSKGPLPMLGGGEGQLGMRGLSPPGWGCLLSLVSDCRPSTIIPSGFSPAKETCCDYGATKPPSPPLTEKRGVCTRHGPPDGPTGPLLLSAPHSVLLVPQQRLQHRGKNTGTAQPVRTPKRDSSSGSSAHVPGTGTQRLWCFSRPLTSAPSTHDSMPALPQRERGQSSTPLPTPSRKEFRGVPAF